MKLNKNILIETKLSNELMAIINNDNSGSNVPTLIILSMLHIFYLILLMN